VLLNKIFDDQKYPFRPIDFFGENEEIARESAAYALHLRQTDAIVLEEAYLGYIEKNVRNFRNEIRAIACTRPFSNTLIATGKNMAAPKLAKFIDVLLMMHSDPNSRISEISSIYPKANGSRQNRRLLRLDRPLPRSAEKGLDKRLLFIEITDAAALRQ